MKKHLLLTILIATAITSFAQPTITYGVRAGITSSGMRGDAINNFNNVLDFTRGMVSTKNHTGYFGGGYVSIPVSSNLSVEPALYYSQKGFDMVGAISGKGISFLGVKAKASLITQYIDLPVLLKANLNGFQVFGGPQVSYLAAANLKTSAGLLGINLLSYKTDATSQFNKWDAALTGGIGYQFGNGIHILAAYDQGLSKADANQNLKSYNHSFKVGLGMGF